MNKTKLIFFISLLISIAVTFLLITGSNFLLIVLLEDPYLPSGTLITWAGLIAMPMAVFTGNKKLRNPSSLREQVFSNLLKAFILLSILWLPVSYFLAGNLSFTFSEKAVFQGGQLAMKIFWWYSYAVAAIPIALLILHYVIRTMKQKT